MTLDEILAKAPETLDYTGEFGAELACFLPLVHWLHGQGHLRQRRVRTYAGMRPFYPFIEPERFLEKDEARLWLRIRQRLGYLPNNNEYQWVQSPFESFPDYRQIYGPRSPFSFAAPLLMIHNKFCKEFSHGPFNFIPIEALDQIFRSFKRKYQIIYSRDGFGSRDMKAFGFSADHNIPITFGDDELLSKHPEVISFERMVEAESSRFSYNELKLLLLSNCHHFIITQGGFSYLCAMLSGSLVVILHRTGLELRRAYAHGIFRRASNPAPTFLVTRNTAQLLDALAVFEKCFTWGNRVTAHPSSAALLARYSPERQADPRHRIAIPSVW